MPNKYRVLLSALAALWVLGVAAPSAGAAVTSSTVTAPASGTFFQQNANNPADPAHQITITGTTTNDGTPGNVDLVCTFGNADGSTGDVVIAPDLSVASDGSFSFSGPVPFLQRACVIRAVPAGVLPSDLTPFVGPKIAGGVIATTAVQSGPNTGQLFDFFDNDAQFSGDGDYASVGRGGMFDAWPIDPSTFVKGADLFVADDYLADANSDRSDIEIDGKAAYASNTADALLGFAGEGFSGLPALTFTESQDPATGDVTIHESEMLVQCEPSPATYPATATSCTSFASTGVRFDRTIVQGQDGRQAQITDTYTSVDGKQHAIDLRYGQDFPNADSGFNFPWVDGTTYKTHAAGATEPAPPTAPASVFVNADNTLADGDLTSAQGAITFASKPNGFAFVPRGLFGAVQFDVAYTRTVSAGSSVSLKTTYSWAFTVADAHSLATLAEQQDMAPAVTTGAASAITTSGANVAGSVNPNGSPTTYQFQFGTSTAYGQSTPITSAGSSTSAGNVSAALTGLQAGMTYHYRLVATNAIATTDGPDATFKTASPPPPPPPPVKTKLTVGKVKVKRNAATVPLSCTGAAKAICKGTITGTIRVKRRHRRVTETVASAKFSIKAGAKKTIKVTLNRKGRHALAGSASHKLRVTLTVRLAGKKVAGRTVTYDRKRFHIKILVGAPMIAVAP